MYTFSVIQANPGYWWVAAISWGQISLYIQDEDLSAIINMNLKEMQNHLIKKFDAKRYDNESVYWTSEELAKKAMDEFYQPRLTAHLLTKGN